jgi:hypothetical protein
MAAKPHQSCRPRSTSRLGRAPTFPTAFPRTASEPDPAGRRAAHLRSEAGRVRGNQGRREIAAAGGADRRSAKNADRPLNQSREAHLAAWPLHSPRGGTTSGDLLSGRQGGTPVACVGFRVGSSVGVAAPSRAGYAASAGGWGRAAELASEAARAEGASPPAATDRGRRAGAAWRGQGPTAAACGPALWCPWQDSNLQPAV